MVGILLLGTQYVSDLTQGASADVVNYDLLPPEIAVSKDDYQKALELVDEYYVHTDLASKNETVQELRELMAGWNR